MYKILINVASFLVGYLIFLTLYTRYKNIETFANKKEDIKIKTSEEDIIDDKFELPNKGDLLMYLSSYNDNIKNEKLKWYSENNEKDESLNKGSFFSFNNIIQFKPFILNDKILGANINNTTLSGPNSDYFSNTLNNDLKQFTIMFHIKINKLSEANTLFEMICNTTTKYDKEEEEEIYIPNSIYIKLNRIKDDIYNIIINIGSNKYTIDDINDNIFNNDITFMSLKFDGKKIVFILNDNLYNFKYDSYDLITSNQPIIINKNGNIDGILYNFAYYKDSLNTTSINKYKKYVNYYIYGAINAVDDNNKLSKDILLLKDKYETSMVDNKKLLENLKKCIDINK